MSILVIFGVKKNCAHAWLVNVIAMTFAFLVGTCEQKQLRIILASHKRSVVLLCFIHDTINGIDNVAAYVPGNTPYTYVREANVGSQTSLLFSKRLYAKKLYSDL